MKCPCLSSAKYEAEQEGRRKDSNEFYSSLSWRKLRAAVKARANGCDEWELARTGRIVPGNLVHHILPVNERPDLRLSLHNLIYVTQENHDRIHTIYRRGKHEKEMLMRELLTIVTKNK